MQPKQPQREIWILCRIPLERQSHVDSIPWNKYVPICIFLNNHPFHESAHVFVDVAIMTAKTFCQGIDRQRPGGFQRLHQFPALRREYIAELRHVGKTDTKMTDTLYTTHSKLRGVQKSPHEAG